MRKPTNQFAEEIASGAIDPNDLTHDERVRAQALAQACRYYVETICKDGDLYREMMRDNRVLKPATYTRLLETAFAFEAFIMGALTKDAAEIVADAAEEEALRNEGRSPKPTPEQE